MAVEHLYIHVPFCTRRCSYCDFSIAVRSETPVEEYIGALRKELDRQHAALAASTLQTVYLGGGTPSRLGGSGVARVIDLVRDGARLADDAEITIEANPDDVTQDAVNLWSKAGVNRVSLGAQTFDDGTLKWMHRTHDAAQIGQAVKTLRDGGISNISLDLIFALPSHLNRSWADDLEKALELEPAHLSLYGLTVEERTPLARWAERGTSVQGTEEDYEEEFLAAHAAATGAGLDHYEVSNFGRPGLESRHNSAYWTGVPYLGVGPSAHSFDGNVRRWNIPAYSAWLRCLAAGTDALEGKEVLTAENRAAEDVYLGLRTKRGLSIRPDEMPTVRTWEAAGWALVDEQQDRAKVRLTPKGWLRLDSLAAVLVARRSRIETSAVGSTPSHCYI
jgi:oxygen-independent coproporphyrinogen-3 oxidase